MKYYRLTMIGLAISTVIYLLTIIIGVDLFEKLIELLHGLEKYELDELIIPTTIFIAFSLFELIDRQRSHKIEVEREKIKIYEAMIFSTQHILNNFLNQIQVFKQTAEETENFDPEVLGYYDEIIDEASGQIDSLCKVTEINEVSILESIKPK
ncbi:MAG: hypothetical protein GY714_09395 [Desulfobacterales bacterium]|nr:hypothetical protein [Desulfobacterales bacterium]MCP4163405.1 hypothetical protein [Deltaproteobacteria bacterium]